MANNETQVSSLPLPPTQYYNLYTDENIRRNRAPRPPQPPGPHDTYSMFGIQYNNDEMIRSLESQNIKRLTPVHFDRRKELRKLNHSLFINFLDLIDMLILNPESPRRQEKIDELSVVFVNMHHLINEYRPHQARETLRVMMELQKRQRVETALRFEKHLERVRQIVNSAFDALPTLAEPENSNREDVEMVEEESDANLKGKADATIYRDILLCKLCDSIV